MVVNLADYEIYVTNPPSHTVSVINSSSDKVIDTIPVGVVPRDIANYNDEKIYVTSDSSTTVSAVNASTYKVRTIPVGVVQCYSK
jgi:YVTN family beta-propeller protein